MISIFLTLSYRQKMFCLDAFSHWRIAILNIFSYKQFKNWSKIILNKVMFTNPTGYILSQFFTSSETY